MALVVLVYVLTLLGPAPAPAVEGAVAPPRLRLEHHRVDVNRARPGELRALPGVGRVIAARIVEARAEAPFSTLEDLRRVHGVGPVSVARVARHTVFLHPP